LHTTVCLSDSQLHLFLQTQLPVGHIQDCVQGLTPYSVTDAILTYASSNRGLAQAQQEDSIREPNPLEDILELCEQQPDETQHRGHASIRISQKSNQLEAVVEEYGSTQASFYLGEIQDDSESLSPAEQSCVIQTPVEVHSPMGTGYEGDSVFEDNTDTPDCEERKKSESEICVDFDDVLAVKDNNEEVAESHAASEDLSEACKSHLADVKPDNETEPDSKESDESGDKEETPLQSIIHEESRNVISEPEVDLSDSRHQMHKEETENEDSHSLPSSNESIIRCSEEESLGEETEDSMQVKSSPDVSNWSEVEGSSSNIFYINGGNEDKEDAQDWEVEDQQYTTKSKSPEPKSAAANVDLTENGDFSILETIRQSGVDDRKFTKQEAPALIPLEGSEEA
ncbi:hypothetical protein XENOCAPTIV_026985, partial [Xenoophorus captivus]